jgi:hypothetical protein
LIVSAFLVNRARPRVEVDQPSAEFVLASDKCAECHSQQYLVVLGWIGLLVLLRQAAGRTVTVGRRID